MNALATDQARRIARAIDETPALRGVRAGIYADAEPDLMACETIPSRSEARVVCSSSRMFPIDVASCCCAADFFVRVPFPVVLPAASIR